MQCVITHIHIKVFKLNLEDFTMPEPSQITLQMIPLSFAHKSCELANKIANFDKCTHWRVKINRFLRLNVSEVPFKKFPLNPRKLIGKFLNK